MEICQLDLRVAGGSITSEKHCKGLSTGMVAYIHHLLTLVEDKTIKSDDRAKLKGYLQKWRHTRMLVGADCMWMY